ncbi:MAG: alpha/beta hydrolase [Hyphomonadaceae bacterium]|nr:alpha/beta hydrolase [Hyphomonadaceae bacterium]
MSDPVRPRATEFTAPAFPGGSGELEGAMVAASLHFPQTLAADPVTWFCAPGGSMGRGYFDLSIAGDAAHSFAAAMTGKGDVVVAINPPGVGDSTPPADGFALTPARMGEAVYNCMPVWSENISGECARRYGRRAPARSIAVGHSMGGGLMLLTQGRHACFDALVLMGANAEGLEWALTESERRYVGDAPGAHANIAALARDRFGAPFPLFTLPEGANVFGPTPVQAAAAISTHQAPMAAALAVLVMIPQVLAPEAARVTAPICLVFGDRDIGVAPAQTVAAFKSALDLTLLTLPDTGHMHFAFSSAPTLFARLWAWSRSALNQTASAP